MSLGCDCACAYQIKKYQQNLTYPFDWIKSDNIKMICDSLDSKFSIFFDNYHIVEQSDNFNNFDNFDNFDNLDKNEKDTKSRLRIKLKNNMILPHESEGFIFNELKYKEKYQRRINRFYDVVSNEKIKKIFIRCDNKQVKQSDKEMLITSLNNYGCVNYEIRYVTYTDYMCIGEFKWKRDYIDWGNIFI